MAYRISSWFVALCIGYYNMTSHTEIRWVSHLNHDAYVNEDKDEKTNCCV